MPINGILYAVDTWLGVQNGKPPREDSRIPYLYQLFLSNVKHAGLTNKIVPIRMRSLEAAKALNVMADLIYIDASHDTQSVIEDIINWTPHLKEGGLICGDDWGWESVQAGVIQCSKKFNKKIQTEGNFWWFE